MSSRSAPSEELLAALEAGATVVTPNQRSAHWLKLLYANRAAAGGNRAWATPNILAFNAFVAGLWRNTANRRGERVLSAEQANLLWERVVTESDWSSALLNRQAAAGASFRSWERMHQWQIDRAALTDHAERYENAEARALLEWSDRFESRCKDRGWLPATLLPTLLLGERIAGKLIVTVASRELLPNQRALLQHLVRCGARWEELGRTRDQSQECVVECDSAESELHSAADWARRQLLGGAANIGVVVPELRERIDTVRRVFSEALMQDTRLLLSEITDDRQAPFAIAAFHQLADFPLARSALDLLRFVAGGANPQLAGSVLRSPFLRGSTVEGSERALADAQMRSAIREQYDLLALARLATSNECSIFAACIEEARRVCSAMPIRMLPSAYAEQFAALWGAFGWPGDVPLRSADEQVAMRLHGALGEFGALDELLGPLSFAQAAREFDLHVRSIHYEPRSAPAPITVTDASAIQGMQFDVAWIAGMDEARWPPQAMPDPFIPIELQVRAQMPMANAQLARENAFEKFHDLRTIADRVVFSWARTDRDTELQPCSWLRDLAQTSSPSPIVSYAARIFADKPVLEIIEEQSAPKLMERTARGGARIFELQSRCPFRAFAELRLAALPLDSVLPRIDASDRGMLIHAALADIWETLRGSEGLAAYGRDQLEALARTMLGRHAAKFLEGVSSHRVRMWQIEIELAVERVLELLALDRQRAPFRVLGRPETTEQSTVGSLSFELRLDRTDELLGEAQRGSRVIVDYKTGDTQRTSWLGERPEQPQLPLYAVTHPDALAAVVFATLGSRGVGYQGVASQDDLVPGVKAFSGKELPAPYAGWNGLLAYWKSVIDRLAGEFAVGVASVDPLPTACRYCALNTLCRVHELEAAGHLVEGD